LLKVEVQVLVQELVEREAQVAVVQVAEKYQAITLLEVVQHQVKEMLAVLVLVPVLVEINQAAVAVAQVAQVRQQVRQSAVMAV
jgi:hypothetical protein